MGFKRTTLIPFGSATAVSRAVLEIHEHVCKLLLEVYRKNVETPLIFQACGSF